MKLFNLIDNIFAGIDSALKGKKRESESKVPEKVEEPLTLSVDVAWFIRMFDYALPKSIVVNTKDRKYYESSFQTIRLETAEHFVEFDIIRSHFFQSVTKAVICLKNKKEEEESANIDPIIKPKHRIISVECDNVLDVQNLCNRFDKIRELAARAANEAHEQRKVEFEKIIFGNM